MREVYTVQERAANTRFREMPLDINGRFLVVRSCSAPFDCRIQARNWSEVFSFKEGDEFLVPDRIYGVEGRPENFHRITLLNESSSDDLIVELSTQNLPFSANDERIPPTSLTPSGVLALLAAGESDTYNGVKSNGRRRQWFYLWVVSVGRVYVYNDNKVAGACGCSAVNAPGFLPIPSDGNFKIVNPDGAAVNYVVAEIFGR